MMKLHLNSCSHHHYDGFNRVTSHSNIIHLLRAHCPNLFKEIFPKIDNICDIPEHFLHLRHCSYLQRQLQTFSLFIFTLNKQKTFRQHSQTIPVVVYTRERATSVGHVIQVTSIYFTPPNSKLTLVKTCFTNLQQKIVTLTSS